jgi:ankyrin repeat protein
MSEEKKLQSPRLFEYLLRQLDENAAYSLHFPEKERSAFKDVVLADISPFESCKVLIFYLMDRKKKALIQEENRVIHELTIKVALTFMACQNSVQQQALIAYLRTFPHQKKDSWDEFLLNLENIAAMQLPTPQNVRVFLSVADYQSFIKELIKLTDSLSLPLNETLLVSLLIAGAEKIPQVNKKVALSFSDEVEINDFIKIFSEYSERLSKIYQRNLNRSKLVICLQEKSQPLVKKLEAVTDQLVQVLACLEILNTVGDAEYKTFLENVAALQTTAQLLCKQHEQIQKRAGSCLEDSTQCNDLVITLVEQQLALVDNQHEALLKGVDAYQIAIDAKIQLQREKNQQQYTLITSAINQLHQQSNQSLLEVMVLREATSSIPMALEGEAWYLPKIELLESQRTAVDEKMVVIQSFQQKQSDLAASVITAKNFAALPLIEQYQACQKLTGDVKTLREEFEKIHLPLFNRVKTTVNEIKQLIKERITATQTDIDQNNVRLEKSQQEKKAFDEEESRYKDEAILLFDKNSAAKDEAILLLDKNSAANESKASIFQTLNFKILNIETSLALLEVNRSNLEDTLRMACQALSAQLKQGIQETDRDFSPVLKYLVGIILGLFLDEGEKPKAGWLKDLQDYYSQQETLEKQQLACHKLETQIAPVFPDFLSGDTKEIEPKLLKQIEEAITLESDASAPNLVFESGKKVVGAIANLKKHQIQQETLAKSLKDLGPLQEKVKGLQKKLAANLEALTAIQSKLSSAESQHSQLNTIEKPFLLATDSWEMFAKHLAMGDPKKLEDFLVVRERFLPGIRVLCDLLRCVVAFGNLKGVQWFVEKHPSVLSVALPEENQQQNMLLVAYQRLRNNLDSEEAMQIFNFLLLRKDVNINLPNSCGDTLLYLAVANNDIEVVRKLLQSGSTQLLMSPLNNKQHTPLYQAIVNLNVDMVNLLLANKAIFGTTEILCEETIDQLHCFRDRSDDTLLHIAVRQKNLPLIEQFLAVKRKACVVRESICAAPIDYVNSEGESALHVAAVSNNLDAVKCLVTNGANVMLKNSNGCTPLHLATDAKIIRYLDLVEHTKIDPQVKTDARDTFSFSGFWQSTAYLMDSIAKGTQTADSSPSPTPHT